MGTSIANPNQHPPLIICGETGPGKHKRAVQLRDERWRSLCEVDDLPVVLRIDRRYPAAIRAFAELATSGMAVIGVCTGGPEALPELFEHAGVALPANTESEFFDEDAYRQEIIARRAIGS